MAITTTTFEQFLINETCGEITLKDFMEVIIDASKQEHFKPRKSFRSKYQVKKWIDGIFEGKSDIPRGGIILESFVWMRTQQGYKFWEDLHNKWEKYYEETSDIDEVVESNDVLFNQCELNLLSRAFYTNTDERRAAAAEAIKTFFASVMLHGDTIPGLKTVETGEIEKMTKIIFTGDIKYTSLWVSLFQKVENEQADDEAVWLMLKILSEVKKLGDHSWVIVECKKAYLSWLNGGESTVTFWESNRRKIWFDASTQEVYLKEGNRTYMHIIDTKDLIG